MHRRALLPGTTDEVLGTVEVNDEAFGGFTQPLAVSDSGKVLWLRDEIGRDTPTLTFLDQLQIGSEVESDLFSGGLWIKTGTYDPIRVRFDDEEAVLELGNDEQPLLVRPSPSGDCIATRTRLGCRGDGVSVNVDQGGTFYDSAWHPTERAFFRQAGTNLVLWELQNQAWSPTRTYPYQGGRTMLAGAQTLVVGTCAISLVGEGWRDSFECFTLPTPSSGGWQALASREGTVLFGNRNLGAVFATLGGDVSTPFAQGFVSDNDIARAKYSPSGQRLALTNNSASSPRAAVFELPSLTPLFTLDDAFSDGVDWIGEDRLLNFYADEIRVRRMDGTFTTVAHDYYYSVGRR